MFKCLCGGGTTNTNTSNPNEQRSKYDINDKVTKSDINNRKNQPNESIHNGTESSPHININISAGAQTNTNNNTTSAMTKLQSTSPDAPNNKQLRNGKFANHLNNSNNNSNDMTDESQDDVYYDDDDDEYTLKPHKSQTKNKHRYKSRPNNNNPNSKGTMPPSPQQSMSYNNSDSAANNYYIYENFTFSVETFDFNLHYKLLIELSIKCLDMGPEVLSPQIFYAHNEIQCVVAVLHENNKQKAIASSSKNDNNNSSRDDDVIYDRDVNNIIGFSICYPHSNCRPYPDSVWMIGWLCADHHRIKSYHSQYYVLEALIRKSFNNVNPNSTNIIPKSVNLKAHLIEAPESNTNNGTNNNLNINGATGSKLLNAEKTTSFTRKSSYSQSQSQSNNLRNKKSKKNRDKGIGIYAAFYHHKAQKLYESLGFEKIARIGNYYTSDKGLFDDLFHRNNGSNNMSDGGMHSENKNEDNDNERSENDDASSKKKDNVNDAYLYCRGDLAHCRLLLGMEYFNYKKWPKSKTDIDDDEAAAVVVDDVVTAKGNKKNSSTAKDTTTANSKDEKDKDGKTKKKKHHGPKILQEYLQSRIAAQHRMQEQQRKQYHPSYNKHGNSNRVDTNRRDRGDRRRARGTETGKVSAIELIKQKEKSDQNKDITNTSNIRSAATMHTQHNGISSADTARSSVNKRDVNGNGNMHISNNHRAPNITGHHHSMPTGSGHHPNKNKHSRTSGPYYPPQQQRRTIELDKYGATNDDMNHQAQHHVRRQPSHPSHQSQQTGQRAGVTSGQYQRWTGGGTGSTHDYHHSVQRPRQRDPNHGRYVVSKGDHRPYAGFREIPPTKYFYQDSLPPNPNNKEPNNENDNGKQISNNNEENPTHHPSYSGKQLANSHGYPPHHNNQGSGNIYHSSHYGHHNPHHPRTYTGSSHMQQSTNHSHRPSVTPTPTYDQHSQAIYNPYHPQISTVSTNTYTVSHGYNDYNGGPNLIGSGPRTMQSMHGGTSIASSANTISSYHPNTNYNSHRHNQSHSTNPRHRQMDSNNMGYNEDYIPNRGGRKTSSRYNQNPPRKHRANKHSTHSQQ